jgi:hypothetical protein
MSDNSKKTIKPALRVSPDLVLPQQSPSETTEVVSPEPEELVSGVVSSGHSIHINIGRVASGYDAMLSRPVYRQTFRIALPGEVVELPRSEIDKLRAQGFLVDPDRVDPANMIASDPVLH